MYTPWGVSDWKREGLEGNVVLVTTPGHGGYGARSDWAEKNLSKAAQAVGEPYGGYLWYEEDCNWSVLLADNREVRAWDWQMNKGRPPTEGYSVNIKDSINRWNPSYLEALATEQANKEADMTTMTIEETAVTETTTEPVTVRIDAKLLKAALTSVKPAIYTKRATLPVLGNFLLRSDETGVYIEATNLELSVQLRLDSAVAEGMGSITVPFDSLLKWLPNKGTVTLHWEQENKLTASVGASSLSLPTISADEFPGHMSPTEDDTCFGTISRSVFEQIAAHIVPSASTDDNRPVLAGVCLKSNPDGSLKAIAADGFRLAVAEYKMNYIPPSEGEVFSIIVPRNLFGFVSKMSNSDFAIKLAGNGNRIYLAGQGVKIYSRLIDGNYVNYSHIIPIEADQKNVVSVEAGELTTVLVSMTTTAKEHANILQLSPCDGALLLTVSEKADARDPEAVVYSKSLVNAVQSTGSDTQALNLLYLAAAVKPVEKKQTIEIRFRGDGAPFTVNTPGAMHIIMPMHIGSR